MVIRFRIKCGTTAILILYLSPCVTMWGWNDI